MHLLCLVWSHRRNKGNLWLEKRDNKRDGAIADQRKAGNDNEIRYEAYDGNGSDRSSSGCPDAGRSDRSGKTDGNGIKLHDSAGETPWKTDIKGFIYCTGRSE